MGWIASVPYYKVERSIHDGKQLIHVEERRLMLYSDTLHTKHRQFKLQDVFDISYRMSTIDNGMMYLHTKQGVFMYSVREAPEHFIEAYRQAVSALAHPKSE